MLPRKGSATLWLSIGVLGLLLMLIAVTLTMCDARKDAGRARAGQTMADGRTAAAGDASQVRDRADTRNDQIDDTVKGATDEVRNAPDAAAGRRAARDGVCRIDPSACAR